MQVILSREDKRTAILEVFEDEPAEGEPGLIFEKKIKRFNDSDINFLATNCSMDTREVLAILRRLFDAPSPQSEEEEEIAYSIDESRLSPHFRQSLLSGGTTPLSPRGGEESSPPSHLVIRVRPINRPRQFSQSYTDIDPGECLKQAFNYTTEGLEPILEWDSTRVLCCLDVDYHDVPLEERPPVALLEDMIRRIVPKPLCWHPSHAGGAKLYYIASPGFTAEELACVASFSWSNLDCTATFDFGKTSRHPGFPRERDQRPAPCQADEIKYLYGSSDVTPVRRMLNSELEYEEIQSLLDERGWFIGQYLDHSQCLINPSDTGKSNVYIADTGVYCHSCSARGLGPNPNNPGFTHYGQLVRRVDNKLSNMVKNFCHAEHATIVLENLYPQIPKKIALNIYKVMLKIVHTVDDPRINLAMKNGDGYVRSNGQWISTDGLSNITQNLQTFVRSLPAVLIPSTEDGFAINTAKYTSLCNTGDCEQHGYPNIEFLRGVQIFGHHLKYRNNVVYKRVITKSLRGNPPQYLSKTKRMPEKQYNNLFTDEFPGLEMDYLKLLVAAKGVSEGQTSQCPYLLINGPSGSGKSTVPHLAAGICGDKAEEPIFLPDVLRFRQSLMDSAQASSFVVVNEIFKMAKMAKLSPVQALNPMLSLTPDSRSHVLYVGSVAFGRLPVFVLTDIDTPKEIWDDIQISRRFICYDLQRRNYWEDTFTSRGIRPHEFRLISHEHALACDSLLSDVIDTFFTRPMSLKDIAQALGGNSLEAEGMLDNVKDETLKRFYKLVCDAPLLTGSDASRYAPHAGWKRINKGEQNELSQVWQELTDAPEVFSESRVAGSTDWSTLLGIELPPDANGKRRGIKLSITPFTTNSIYVRFVNGDCKRNPNWVNGKIIKPFKEVEPCSS